MISRQMTVTSKTTAAEFRMAELMAAISLATDLGMGQPMEQALRTCLIALGIGERLGLEAEQLSEVFYVALLRFLGCSADARESAQLNAGDDIALRAAIAPVLGASRPQLMGGVLPRLAQGHSPPRRARTVASFMARAASTLRAGVAAHCELGEDLARRIGLSEGVRRGLGHAFERWNGHGAPNGIAGEKIALSARIVFLARDAEVIERALGAEAAVAAVASRRAAGSYDPGLVDLFRRQGGEVLQQMGEVSAWEAVLEAEPEPRPWVPESRLDQVLEAFADFADLKSPYTVGHSRGVAELGARAASNHSQQVRRAGLLHDLGRASVPNGIWDKRGKLSADEWERVRLHAYYSERILARSAVLAPLATVAGMHHERLDGSGYHRGAVASAISWPARILAAADACQAMSQPRPHRPALTPDQASRELSTAAATGKLDPAAVEAVLEAAGHPVPHVHREWPAGLSEREVEVLRLLCRGQSKKEIGSKLGISSSTADHHVRHIYEKLGVGSRAGAAVFALQHDLLQ